jgi:hypothetical protein
MESWTLSTLQNIGEVDAWKVWAWEGCWQKLGMGRLLAKAAEVVLRVAFRVGEEKTFPLWVN